MQRILILHHSICPYDDTDLSWGLLDGSDQTPVNIVVLILFRYLLRSISTSKVELQLADADPSCLWEVVNPPVGLPGSTI